MRSESWRLCGPLRAIIASDDQMTVKYHRWIVPEMKNPEKKKENKRIVHVG